MPSRLEPVKIRARNFLSGRREVSPAGGNGEGAKLKVSGVRREGSAAGKNGDRPKMKVPASGEKVDLGPRAGAVRPVGPLDRPVSRGRNN
jgi:hypothetical protein